MLKKHFYIFLLAAISLTGCAKRGSITGGLKDTIPPTLLQSSPKNFSTQFTGKTIKLTFDEYVKLKDINKQLVISPPMKIAPIFMPTTASKQFTISIKDTLQENTTYSFNFGQSIQDNNEGNPYPQFKYVFSTGDYIDSLSLGGTIKDAYSKDPDNFVSVMLYEVNDTFTDSILYKQPPRYITNTLDSLTQWKLENLKQGRYLLVALKDNNNNKYDPKSDKIGFHSQFVTVPNDTLYEIELFQEAVPFKALKPSLDTGTRLLIGYEGKPDSVSVKLSNLDQTLETIVTKVPDKDSLSIWFKPIKADSLNVNVQQYGYSKDYVVKIKAQKQDTLSFSARPSGILPLRENFRLEASKPIVRIDTTLIHIRNKDSMAVAYTSKYDAFTKTLELDFKKEPLEKYKIEILPSAMTDFYEQSNDTLSYTLTTRNTSDYANLRLTLENVRRFPIIIELTNAQGVVKASEYSEAATQIDFNFLDPAIYTLRIIYDDNKNKVWDSGNYLKKLQAEEVLYDPEEIELRANWDWEQKFRLP